MVAPYMINSEHTLYNVNGVFNGIFIHGNMLGDTMFYGRGAGKLPTASAVVADVVDAAKHSGTNIMTIWEEEKITLGNMENFKCKFFVRVKDTNKQDIEKTFGNVSFVEVEGVNDELAFVTDVISEGEFDNLIKNFTLINRIRTAF